MHARSLTQYFYRIVVNRSSVSENSPDGARYCRSRSRGHGWNKNCREWKKKGQTKAKRAPTAGTERASKERKKERRKKWKPIRTPRPRNFQSVKSTTQHRVWQSPYIRARPRPRELEILSDSFFFSSFFPVTTISRYCVKIAYAPPNRGAV